MVTDDIKRISDFLYDTDISHHLRTFDSIGRQLIYLGFWDHHDRYCDLWFDALQAGIEVLDVSIPHPFLLEPKENPTVEDIKESHLRRGHKVTEITTFSSPYRVYICRCGASISLD